MFVVLLLAATGVTPLLAQCSGAAISTVVTVQSEAGAKCASTFVNVPVGGTANGCTFTIP